MRYRRNRNANRASETSPTSSLAARLPRALVQAGGEIRISHAHTHTQGPLHALLAWATVWAQGDIPPWATDIWSGALARPFWKTPEQRSVRPIMCTEALVKFAFGIVATAAKAHIDIAVGPHQYGAGRPAGAENEIAELRAATQSRPGASFVSLDVTPCTWPTTIVRSHRRPGQLGGTGFTWMTASSRPTPRTSPMSSGRYTAHLRTSTYNSNRPSAPRTIRHTRDVIHQTPSGLFSLLHGERQARLPMTGTGSPF